MTSKDRDLFNAIESDYSNIHDSSKLYEQDLYKHALSKATIESLIRWYAEKHSEFKNEEREKKLIQLEKENSKITVEKLKVGMIVKYRDGEVVLAKVVSIDNEKEVVNFIDNEDFDWEERFVDISDTVIKITNLRGDL